MKGKITLTDYFQCRVDSSLIEVKDDYYGGYVGMPGTTHPSGLGTVPEQQPTQQQPGRGLRVKISATHAGRLTHNYAMYLPAYMKDSVSSYTSDYPKPLLVHHDKHSDPIGRIVSAQYVDTSGLAKETLHDKMAFDVRGRKQGIITRKLIDDFVGGGLPWIKQASIVTDYLHRYVTDSDTFQGLGYIELIANVVDPDAIQKVLDGRYLTGSVSFDSDKALCSVCKKEWVSEGPCDHQPGRTYDEMLCYLIMGNMDFREYSFVNLPADSLSKVMEVLYNGVSDSIQLPNMDRALPMYDLRWGGNDNLIEEDKMKVADSTVRTEEQNIPASDATPVIPEVPVADAVEPILEAQPTPQAEDSTPAPELDRLSVLIDKLLTEQALTDEESEELYGLQAAELAVVTNKDGIVEDTKLSAEKRKSLSKSVFCGPNRSFPVPDGAHAVAARKLIDGYKGQGNKDNIVAAIDRKAKALGCAVENQDSNNTPVVPPVEEPVVTPVVDRVKELSDQLSSGLAPFVGAEVNEEALLKIADTVVASVKKLVGDELFSTYLINNGLAVDPKSEIQLLDDIVTLETLAGTLRDELSNVKEAYTDLRTDRALLEDQLIESKRALRAHRTDIVKSVKQSQKQVVTDEQLITMNDETLLQEYTNMTKAIDFSQLTGTLSDGMSRTPTGHIESPVGGVSSGTAIFKPEELKQMFSDMQEQWLMIRMSQGEQAANQFMAQWRKRMQNLLTKDTEN